MDRKGALMSRSNPIPAQQGYDIIGDIHGYAGALRRLLVQMGYR
jgi:hypothetical protein